jgi:hypothetical protein
VQRLSPLILPSDVDGAFVSDRARRGNRLHLAAPGAMRLAMGPTGYQHILAMALGACCTALRCVALRPVPHQALDLQTRTGVFKRPTTNLS